MPSKPGDTGIYKITCNATGNIYIGSSAYSIQGRFRRHRGDLLRNEHENQYIQNSWNKYGQESFKFEVIESCAKELVLIREQFYIDTLKPQFNMCPVAGSCLGKKASAETKRKMSLARLGKTIKQTKWSNERRYNRLMPIFKNFPVVGKHIKTGVIILFASLLDAHNAGFNRAEIKRHIEGRRKSYKRHTWSLGGVPFL